MLSYVTFDFFTATNFISILLYI